MTIEQIAQGQKVLNEIKELSILNDHLSTYTNDQDAADFLAKIFYENVGGGSYDYRESLAQILVQTAKEKVLTDIAHLNQKFESLW